MDAEAGSPERTPDLRRSRSTLTAESDTQRLTAGHFDPGGLSLLHVPPFLSLAFPPSQPALGVSLFIQKTYSENPKHELNKGEAIPSERDRLGFLLGPHHLPSLYLNSWHRYKHSSSLGREPNLRWLQ